MISREAFNVQEGNRQPLAAETRGAHVGFVVDNVTLEQVFFRISSVSPVRIIIPPVFHTA
jgi:hypothetical protein